MDKGTQAANGAGGAVQPDPAERSPAVRRGGFGAASGIGFVRLASSREGLALAGVALAAGLYIGAKIVAALRRREEVS